MLDVFPLSYGFLVPQCLHTIIVLSTNLFPSSLYLTGKPKCSHLNDAGRSSSSVPLLSMNTLHLTSVWIELVHNVFFFINQSTDHVCAEPKILIRTDHGSMMIRCTTDMNYSVFGRFQWICVDANVLETMPRMSEPLICR